MVAVVRDTAGYTTVSILPFRGCFPSLYPQGFIEPVAEHRWLQRVWIPLNKQQWVSECHLTNDILAIQNVVTTTSLL
jgi:hypothetical protein